MQHAFKPAARRIGSWKMPVCISKFLISIAFDLCYTCPGFCPSGRRSQYFPQYSKAWGMCSKQHCDTVPSSVPGPSQPRQSRPACECWLSNPPIKLEADHTRCGCRIVLASQLGSVLSHEASKQLHATIWSLQIHPLINEPAGCARSLRGFFAGVQNFGQGLKVIVSRLCTLEHGTESMRQPEKV